MALRVNKMHNALSKVVHIESLEQKLRLKMVKQLEAKIKQANNSGGSNEASRMSLKVSIGGGTGDKADSSDDFDP